MMQTRTPPRPPAFTTQQRHCLGQLAALARGFDYWRDRCAALEQRIGKTPGDPYLTAVLFHARQEEQRATLDLRDAAAYLAGLVRPSSTEAGL